MTSRLTDTTTRCIQCGTDGARILAQGILVLQESQKKPSEHLAITRPWLMFENQTRHIPNRSQFDTGPYWTGPTLQR
jgi:hypothetical protein